MNWRERVVSATVKLPFLSGQGVIVPGGLVLTAAHCLGWTSEGWMTLGENDPVEIENGAGRRFKLDTLAIEPVSDIAVLRVPDNQGLFEEAERYERFCAKVDPVPLSDDEPEPFVAYPVYVLTHMGEWIQGEAQVCEERAHVLWVQTEQQIMGGTSGGPIVNAQGQLVGIVSNFTVSGACNGPAPRPHRTLPKWICDLCCQFLATQ